MGLEDALDRAQTGARRPGEHPTVQWVVSPGGVKTPKYAPSVFGAEAGLVDEGTTLKSRFPATFRQAGVTKPG